MRLHYTRPNALSQLHDELLAAIPSLRPTNGQVVLRVEGSGNNIYLDVPGDSNVDAIATVVTAHVPAPPPPLPDYADEETTRAQLVSAVDNLRSYLALSSPTNAQTISAFKLLIRVVLFLCRRVVLA